MKKQSYKIEIDTTFQDYLPDMPEPEMRVSFERWLAGRKTLEPIRPWLGRFPVYVRDPEAPPSDFFNAPCIGLFSISGKVYADQTMRALLEAAGELLQMEVTDTAEFIYSFNPLQVSQQKGVVDLARCEWKYGRISRIAFFSECLPDGELFTIPEYIVVLYASHSGSLPPEKDFFQWYQRQGYTGLKFTEAEKAWM